MSRGFRALRSALGSLPLLRRFRPYRLYWLTPRLAIAREPKAKHWRKIKAAGIEAVLDLREEACGAVERATAKGITYLWSPIKEYTAPTETDLERAATWVRDRLREDRTVMVHCRAGLGRSPLIASAALILDGVPLAVVQEALRRCRPTAILTESQAALLRGFAERHRGTG